MINIIIEFARAFRQHTFISRSISISISPSVWVFLSAPRRMTHSNFHFVLLLSQFERLIMSCHNHNAAKSFHSFESCFCRRAAAARICCALETQWRDNISFEWILFSSRGCNWSNILGNLQSISRWIQSHFKWNCLFRLIAWSITNHNDL